MATVRKSINANWQTSDPVDTVNETATYITQEGQGTPLTPRSRSVSRESEGKMKWKSHRRVSNSSQSSINLGDVDENNMSDSDDCFSDDSDYSSDDECPMSPVVYHPRREGQPPKQSSTPLGTKINRVAGSVKKRLSLSDVNAIGEVHKVVSKQKQRKEGIKVRPTKTIKKRASYFAKEVVDSVKGLMGIEGAQGALSGERLSHMVNEDSPKLTLEKRKFSGWWKVIAPQVKVDVPISAKDGTFHKENFTSELHLDQYLGLVPRTAKPAQQKRESLSLNLKELETLDEMSRDELLTLIATLKWQEQEQLQKRRDSKRSEREQFVLTRMTTEELMTVATTLKARVKFMKNFQRHLTK